MAEESVAAEVQDGRHRAAEGLQAWPPDEKDIAMKEVELLRLSAMGDGAPADTGGLELQAVDVALLKLGDPHHLAVPDAADLLKRTN